MTPVAMKSAVIFFCVLALVSVANGLKHKTGKGICAMFKISSEHLFKEHGICKIFDPYILHFFPSRLWWEKVGSSCESRPK